MKRIAIALTGVAVLLASCNKKQQGMPETDNSYAVVTVSASPTELTTSYPATLKGIQDVEIRPKVAGFITKIFVQEGQNVSRGQVLFTIDSETYAAAVRSSSEAVKSAQQQINVVKANIATQKLTLENKKLLFEKGIISDYEYQTAVNSLRSLEAQLSSAEAQLGSAKAQLASAKENLSFCTVTAPASGVIGMLPYKVGALVSSSMAEAFTTVSDVSTVHAYFSMNEKQLLELTRTGGGGVQAALKQMPGVTLQLADGSTYGEVGKVDAVGGVIDQSTGAVQVRASFPNSHRILRSGGSARILLPVVSAQAITVPQEATTEIQDKKFVYVVGADNKVKSVEITVEEQSDGRNFVVKSGLKAGDRIVVEGVQNLKNGQQIKPITPAESAKLREKAKQDVKEGKLPM